MHQSATQRTRIEADGEAVRETEEQASADRGGVGDPVTDRQPLPFGEAEELAGGLVGLTRGLAMHAEAIAGVRIELHLDRALEKRQPRKEIRAVFLFDGVAGVLGPIVDFAEKDVPPLGEARDPAHFVDAIEVARREEHARVTRMGREDRHPSADIRELALGVDGAEIGEDGQRALQGLVVRLLIPREGGGFAPAGREQQQDRLREVDPLDLRDFTQRTGFVVGLRPETDTTARTGPAGATGALFGGSLGDRLDEQRVDAAMRVEAGDAGEAGVDHRADAGDGQGSLRDVGRDDHLAAGAGLHRTVLLFWRKLAVKGKDIHAAGLREITHRADGPHDLIRPRHEDENIAFGLFLQDTAHLFRRGVPDRAGRVARQMRVFDLHRIGASVGGQGLGGAEPFRDALGIEGRGHRHDQEIGTMRLLQASRERQGHVGVQVALVEFVEHHRADALELGVRSHLAEQERLRHELDPRLGRLDALEADLVTDFSAEADAAFLRDARSEQTGRDPAGLQDDNLPLDEVQIQEHLRDAGRLTRARRRTEHQPAYATAGGDQVGL